MDNPVFVDEETIAMVHQDEDYDDYNTSIRSRIYETSFTEPNTTEATSTVQLRQKVKRDKLTALYMHLNVTGKRWRGFKKMVGQASRCNQMARRKGC